MAAKAPIFALNKTQADGAVELNLVANNASDADTFVISVLDGSGTSGTLAISIRTYNTADGNAKSKAETLYDSSDAAVTIDLSAVKSVVIEKQKVSSIIVTPTSVVGSYGIVVLPSVTLDD